jgi:peptide/nickel transport system substrate-binding protein
MGSRYPKKALKNAIFQHRPRNWPVGQEMAITRKPLLIGLLLVLVTLALLGGWCAWLASGGNGQAGPAPGGELTALMRSEPVTYIRLAESRATAAGEVVSLLTEGRLVRVNRVTDQLEPWLAERWTESDDRLTYTLTLRDDVRFSDGVALTSADVLFSLRAVYDPTVNSSLAADLRIAGEPLDADAPDAATVVIRFPAPFAPGVRVLANLPIIPRHRLEAALDEGQLAETWSPARGHEGFAGLGPFVLASHVSGQRLVFTRNPHYWRRDEEGVQLPYLDTLTVLVVPDSNTEALRLQSGEADMMVNADIRPEDHSAFKRLADQGRVRLIAAGVGPDPNMLWFNLTSAKQQDPRFSWMGLTAFRQAVSCAVDRQAIADVVYLGEAVPIYGPVSPANRTWYVPPDDPCDGNPGRARELLASIGLADRDGDGMLEDGKGRPVQFSIITQSGHTLRERTAAMVQEQLRQVGVTVDVVGLDPGGIVERFARADYDAIYFGVQVTHTDPAMQPAFWLSSGDFHFWNPGQAAPATDWERRIDELMAAHARTFDLAERQRLFADVQRIFVEHQPALYFVAPRVTIAVSSRVANEQPAAQIPQLLWSADTLAMAETPR